MSYPLDPADERRLAASDSLPDMDGGTFWNARWRAVLTHNEALDICYDCGAPQHVNGLLHPCPACMRMACRDCANAHHQVGGYDRDECTHPSERGLA